MNCELFRLSSGALGNGADREDEASKIGAFRELFAGRYDKRRPSLPLCAVRRNHVSEVESVFNAYGGAFFRRIHVAQNVIAGWDNGFVAFASREEAELAMDELDGVETAEGRKLRIDWTKDSISLGT